MTSSSKGGASSSKRSSAGKARVLSVRRKDALPRKGNVSADLRKPVVQPPIDAPTEPLATASPKKKTRAAGRASRKSAMTALEAPEVEALALVETEVEVEASAILEETTIVEAPFSLPVEAVTFPSTAIGQLPAPAPRHAERALMTVVSRLLSTLCRWTGVRL